MKKYRVIYTFKHSKMGFNNSITVEGISPDHAIEIARNEVQMTYGKGMINRFTFGPVNQI